MTKEELEKDFLECEKQQQALSVRIQQDTAKVQQIHGRKELLQQLYKPLEDQEKKETSESTIEFPPQ